MKNTDQMDYNHFYALGFFKGFVLAATNPAVALQLPDMKDMNSAFLDGVAAGIAQQQRQHLINTNDFTRS